MVLQLQQVGDIAQAQASVAKEEALIAKQKASIAQEEITDLKQLLIEQLNLSQSKRFFKE